MRVIHRSAYRDGRGEISPLNALRATARLGSDWRRKMAGEDRVARVLARVLDDNHYLIRNITLPDVSSDPEDLDMVLIGPDCLWEIEIIHLTGLVKTEEGWMHWDYQDQALRKFPPERIERLQGKAARLTNFLVAQNLPEMEINQIVVLSTPQAPREFTLPGVQLVFLEELPGFIETSLQVFNLPETLPMGTLIEHLGEVDGGESAIVGPTRYWGMTPLQFFVIVLLAMGDICLLSTFFAAVVLYTVY